MYGFLFFWGYGVLKILYLLILFKTFYEPATSVLTDQYHKILQILFMSSHCLNKFISDKQYRLLFQRYFKDSITSSFSYQVKATVTYYITILKCRSLTIVHLPCSVIVHEKGQMCRIILDEANTFG